MIASVVQTDTDRHLGREYHNIAKYDEVLHWWRPVYWKLRKNPTATAHYGDGYTYTTLEYTRKDA